MPLGEPLPDAPTAGGLLGGSCQSLNREGERGERSYAALKPSGVAGLLAGVLLFFRIIPRFSRVRRIADSLRLKHGNMVVFEVLERSAGTPRVTMP